MEGLRYLFQIMIQAIHIITEKLHGVVGIMMKDGLNQNLIAHILVIMRY